MLTRNLIEADEIRLKLNPAALAEKKMVIERLTLRGMRFGTARKKPARPASGKGFAPQVYRAVEQWTKQFKVPLLSLTPIDTVRQLALDPPSLPLSREAQALLARTDSVRKALEQGFQQLNIGPTLDSARAMTQQLSATDPKKLGPRWDPPGHPVGAADAEGDRGSQEAGRGTGAERPDHDAVRSGRGFSCSTRLGRRTSHSPSRCSSCPRSLRPRSGARFFGKVSIDRFKQALYWAELAQQYMPPGLLPRPTPGPRRLRAAGETIEFPKAKEFPRFLLQQGQLDFSIGGASAIQGAYTATVQGLTSTPALYGRPALITATRRAASSAIASIDVGAVIDHLTARTHDSATARLQGIKLPSFDLPGLPFRLDPGTGSSSLDFSMKNAGAELWAAGHRLQEVSWMATRAGRSLNESSGWSVRVVSGLNDLEVVAELSGSMASPKFSVSEQPRQGDRPAAPGGDGRGGRQGGERWCEAKVDSLVADKVEPVNGRSPRCRPRPPSDSSEKQRLDEVEKQSNAELSG